MSNVSKLATVVALSFDGKWLATGSPLASNAYTKLKGEFNTNTAYVADDVVYLSNSGTYTGFYQALQNNTTNNNSAFGYAALKNNTIGTSNSAFGYKALFANTTGFRNNAFGYKSLTANTT